MRRRGLQLTRGHRLTLYCVSLILLFSGIAWAWIHQLDDTGHAGSALRQTNTYLIAVHGLAAMAFVLLLGTLLPGHVRRAWRARKNQRQGAFFLAAITALTLSGYALYYLGDEGWRKSASRFHLWLGLIAPVLLFWHIRAGLKSTANKKSDSTP
jgi:hypothetical protein